jgi:GTP-binding protein
MANAGADAGQIQASLVEAGRLLFAGPCDFIMGAARENQLPESDLPEVAFAGRSNVGKSSLVNALTGRKTLARVSNTPGRTQQVNFFVLSQKLMLVDLPGYGYAAAPKAHVDAWTGLIERYLRGRRQLKRVCLLIDGRHGIKEPDRRAMEVLDQSAVVYQVILTKADKMTEKAMAEIVAKTKEEIAKHTAAYPELLVTSAEKKHGIEAVRAELAGLLET